MPWNDILTIVNGLDTALGAAILAVCARSAWRSRAWLSGRSKKNAKK